MKSRQRNRLRRERRESHGSSSDAPACSPARCCSVPSILAACGGDDDDSSSSGGGEGGGSKDSRSRTGPSYMTDQSMSDFQKQTGIKVDYAEDINDNNEYFTKIRAEPLQGQGHRPRRLGPHRLDGEPPHQPGDTWVQPLDAAKFPNKANLIPILQNPTFDPTRKYTAPWAVRHDRDRLQHQADRARRSRRSTTSSPCREPRPCSPRCATPSGCSCSTRAPTRRSRRTTPRSPRSTRSQKAVERRQDRRVQRQRVRRATSAPATSPAAFAWSGDVAQITLDNPDVRFAIPDSGGMLWSDNFMIPIRHRQGRPRDRVDQLLLRPAERRGAHRGDPVHLAGDGVADELTKLGGDAAEARRQPARRTRPTSSSRTLNIFGPLERARGREVRQAVLRDPRRRLSARS